MYRRHDDAGEWTTEALLEMALNMLEYAREEQSTRKRNRWLEKNSTLEAIRARVESFGS